MMGNEGHLFYGGGFMWIFWVLLIMGVFYLVINLSKSKNDMTTKDNDSPLDILKKRYARGEIDKEEYERRREELSD